MKASFVLALCVLAVTAQAAKDYGVMPISAEGPAMDIVDAAMAPAPGPNGPLSLGPITLGKLVDSLCPEIKNTISSKLTTLSAILALPHIANMQVDVPAGDVVLLGPTDAAFSTLLKDAGLTIAQAIDPANGPLISKILAQHVAVLPSVDSQTATTLGNETLTFMLNNFKDALSSIVSSSAAGPVDATITDDDSLEIPKILGAVSCKDGAQNALIIDSVLVPAEIEATFVKAPAPAPAAVPSVIPAPAPASGAVSTTFGVVAAVVMAAAMF